VTAGYSSATAEKQSLGVVRSIREKVTDTGSAPQQSRALTSPASTHPWIWNPLNLKPRGSETHGPQGLPSANAGLIITPAGITSHVQPLTRAALQERGTE